MGNTISGMASWVGWTTFAVERMKFGISLVHRNGQACVGIRIDDSDIGCRT